MTDPKLPELLPCDEWQSCKCDENWSASPLGYCPPGYHTCEQYKEKTMNEEQIEHMVSRFLQWKLPEDFHPDGGIEFDADKFVKLNPINRRLEPIGTCLLTATQARQMVEFIVSDLPLNRATPKPPEGLVSAEEFSQLIFDTYWSFKPTDYELNNQIDFIKKRDESIRRSEREKVRGSMNYLRHAYQLLSDYTGDDADVLNAYGLLDTALFEKEAT